MGNSSSNKLIKRGQIQGNHICFELAGSSNSPSSSQRGLLSFHDWSWQQFLALSRKKNVKILFHSFNLHLQESLVEKYQLITTSFE